MKSVSRFLPYIIMVLAALPLLAHLVLGTYNRAVADDYCFTVTVEQNGLLGNLDYWYNNWTGTYSSTFFQSSIGLLRAWQLVPSTLIVLWVGSLAWLLYQFAAEFKLRYAGLCATALAVTVLYGVLIGTANVFQSFYWTSGAITYTLPLVILTFLLGVIVSALRSEMQPKQLIPYALLCAGGVMLAGGFAPFYATFQVVFFAVAWLGVKLFAPDSWRNKGLTLFGVGFVFACIAFGILFVAPGNNVRREQYALTLSFGEIIGTTLGATFGYALIIIDAFEPLSLIVPILVAGAVALLYHPLTPQEQIYFRRYQFKWIGLIMLASLVLMAACFFMSVYSINALPPPRAYVLLQLILICTLVAWGYLIGLGLQKEYANRPNRVLGVAAQVVLLVVLMLGPVRSALNVMALMPDFSVFASEWDARHARLTQAALNNEPIGEIEPLSFDLVDIAWLDPAADCVRNFYDRARINDSEVGESSDSVSPA